MEINYIRTQVEPIAHKYTIRIDRVLEEPELFQEELATIRMANENDIVHILINSQGGREDTMKAFLNVMAQCPAHIITEIESDCNSAATMIFLAGDEMRVTDDAEFMIHTGAYGTSGKEGNVRQQVEFFAKSNARLMKKYYKHFLTDSEIEEVINGKDMWMDAEEIVQRLNNRQEIFDNEDIAVDTLGEEKDEPTLVVKIPELTFNKGYFDKTTDEHKTLRSLFKSVAINNNVKFAHNIGIEKLYERVKDFVEIV